MPYNFAGGGSGDQVYLLPPDPREWLPPRHLAWAVRAAVAGMDLAPFTAWYRADGQGKKAYHPELMVALVMYCYCKGIRSSRAVEMATYDDVGARVLAGNLHPDHATVARFVSRHEQAVKGLLVASLAVCQGRPGQRGCGGRGWDEGEGERVDGGRRHRGAAGGGDRRAGGADRRRGGRLAGGGPGG